MNKGEGKPKGEKSTEGFFSRKIAAHREYRVEWNTKKNASERM